MGHGSVVGGSSNIELLPDFRQLKEHCFEFIGHICSEVWNGLNDVVDGIFEHLGCLN